MTRTLADLIHELTRPHLSRNGDRIAYVEPLLETLESLIRPSAAKGDGGSGTGGSRPPISIESLDLWQDIAGKIDREWPYAGHPAALKVPTARKLMAWHNAAAQSHEALYLYELCTKWIARIQEVLTPTKRMPLKGACPSCDKTHVELTDADGVAVFDTAIIAYPGAQPVYAECRVCNTRWEHEDLHVLRDQLV